MDVYYYLARRVVANRGAGLQEGEAMSENIAGFNFSKQDDLLIAGNGAPACKLRIINYLVGNQQSECR